MTKKIIGATIQARMGSERLPGKVLRLIKNKPMILWQVERLLKIKKINKVIVATTDNPADDEIVNFCRTNNIEYFRGSDTDVIDRVSRLLIEHNIDLHLEFFGDSPLIDINLVEDYIQFFLKNENKYDYLSNCIKTTFPPGLEIIIYKSKILWEINSLLNKEDPLREHAGYNVTRFSKKYRIKSMLAPSKFTMPDLYLEVDTAEDFELIEKIFNHFIEMNKNDFSLADIISFIKQNPYLKDLNKDVHRRWKKLRNE